MKKIALPFMIIAFIFVFSAVALKTAQAAEVLVYLNGVELVYNLEAKPQIINDRTMVPIRETANQLGIEVVDYNDETRTMTLKNGDTYIFHTINTDFIIKDGVVEYFTSSIIVENRSLMPIRMLASAIDAFVDWDDANKSVIISTTYQGSLTASEPGLSGGTPQTQHGPAVISAYPNKTNVVTGEEMTIAVTATSLTTEVRLMRGGTVTLATSTEFSQTGNERIFTLRYSPAEVTVISQRLTVVAGDGITLNHENVHAFNLWVDKGADIISVQVHNGSINVGETAQITIKADPAITKVTLRNTANEQIYEAVPTAANLTETTFEFSIQLNAEGEYIFKIGVTTNAGYREVSRQVEIEVGMTAVNLLNIVDVTYNQTEPRNIGREVAVNVITNDLVNKVVLKDQNGNILYTAGAFSFDGTNRTFTVFAKILQGGENHYVVTVYDQTETLMLDKQFTITSSDAAGGGGSFSGSVLKNVVYDPPNVYMFDSFEVRVTTGIGVEVNAKNPNGDTVTFFSDEYSTNIVRTNLPDGGYLYLINIPVTSFGTYTITGISSTGVSEVHYIQVTQKTN